MNMKKNSIFPTNFDEDFYKNNDGEKSVKSID